MPTQQRNADMVDLLLPDFVTRKELALLGGAQAYGELIISANAAATTLTLQNTWYKVTGWTADQMRGVTGSANDMTANVAAEYKMLVVASISASAANHTFQFGMFKNNALIAEHLCEIKPTATAIVVVALHGLEGLAVADVLDLRVQCTDAAGQSVTVKEANFSILSVAAAVGTAVAGSGAANQLALWSSSSGLTGDAGYVVDLTDDSLTLASGAANRPLLTLNNTAGDATGSYLVQQKLSASPANADVLGTHAWQGYNSTPAVTLFAYLYGLISTVTAGAEDGGIAFQTMKAGVDTLAMQLLSGNTYIYGDIIHKNSYGYIFVPVTPFNPTDNAAVVWNGVTKAVGTYTFDMQAVANGSMPADIKAVSLHLIGNWAAAANGSSALARARGATLNEVAIRASAAAINQHNAGICLIGTSGDIEVQITGVQMLASQIVVNGYFI